MKIHSRTTVGVVLSIYALLFFWLFHRHFSPFGVWSAEIEAPRVETRLVRGPTPEYRTEVDDAKEVWRVNETPVYFEVSNPKKFDQAELEVEFQRDAPIVEAGVVKSQDPWRVEKQVLYHEYLEDLEWPRIKEDGLTLWQRDPRYQSVAEFLTNPPEVEEVAVVNASISIKALKQEKIKVLSRIRHEVSLRGPQDIYFYTAGEDIEVKFLFQDVNRHDGADEAEVRLWHGGELVGRTILEDDGIEWGTSERRPPRDLMVKHEKPEPGVYRLIVNTTDDIFIRRIETAQGKMVWKNTLYLGDEVGYRADARSLTVYSNGQGFALRVPHPESAQEVVWRENAQTVERLNLMEHNKQYNMQMPWKVAGDVLAVTASKGDIVLTTDGFFALSPDEFFLPEPISYVSDLDLDRLEINYVLARYNPDAQADGGAHEKSIRVAIHDIDQTAPLQFFVGTPHGQQQRMEIWGVKVKLTKPRLTFGTIWRKIETIWR